MKATTENVSDACGWLIQVRNNLRDALHEADPVQAIILLELIGDCAELENRAIAFKRALSSRTEVGDA